jgi:hypothetical protein
LWNDSSPAILLAESSSSKQEELAKGMMNFALRSIFVYTSQVIFKCRKMLRHAASGFAPPLKKIVMRIFIALKNQSPRPGLNPRTLSPLASMLTITTPSRLITTLKIMLSNVAWYKNAFTFKITTQDKKQLDKGEAGIEIKSCV